MNALSWNCRRLGNQHAVSVLSHLMREKAPKIVFLTETKQTVDERRRIKDELNFQGGLVVPCDGSWGGLVMLWKEEVNLHIQTYSPHHINAIILTDPGVPWQITGFYGYSKECRKHDPRPCCTIFNHGCFFRGCL